MKEEPIEVNNLQIKDAWQDARALVEKLQLLYEQQKKCSKSTKTRYVYNEKCHFLFESFLESSMCEQKLFKILEEI